MNKDEDKNPIDLNAKQDQFVQLGSPPSECFLLDQECIVERTNHRI